MVVASCNKNAKNVNRVSFSGYENGLIGHLRSEMERAYERRDGARNEL